jgi:hypothetical protein
MKRTAVVLAGLALSSALVACGEDDGPTSPVSTSGSALPSPSGTPATGSPSGTPEPSTTAAPTSAPPSAGAPAPSASPGGEEPAGQSPGQPPFAADTSTDVEQASGGPLSVVAVRVAPQPGYDRVVFELAGRNPGRPGWRVQYVEDPSRDGSGEPVELDGEAALLVTITGAGYPMDTGVDEVSGAPALPAGLRRVRDLELGAVFEGQYEAFIGVSERAPFRVFRLDGPARVVVDIRTS